MRRMDSQEFRRAGYGGGRVNGNKPRSVAASKRAATRRANIRKHPRCTGKRVPRARRRPG